MNTLKNVLTIGSLLFAVSAIAFAARTAESRTRTAQDNPKHSTTTDQEEESQVMMEYQEPNSEGKMHFGNFSVSLAVKDLKASKAFYEKLDFQQVFGGVDLNFVIMQNGTTTIGLFHGMFENNILTFNPGWNHKTETLEKFQDVRDLQATIKERGITPMQEADAGEGPASFILVDPDGNTIFVDQHVPKPE